MSHLGLHTGPYHPAFPTLLKVLKLGVQFLNVRDLRHVFLHEHLAAVNGFDQIHTGPKYGASISEGHNLISFKLHF